MELKESPGTGVCDQSNPAPLVPVTLGATKAFTLIELLVVIAIIGILAALLFPALAGAKNRAQMAYDLNNNKQIMLAMIMYAHDSNDRMPQPGWPLTVASWAAGPGIPLNAGGVATYPIILPQQQASFTRGLLYPYLKTDRVLLCPADKPNPKFYARQILTTSYVWNLAINNWGDGARTLKLGDFRSDAVMQWETDESNPFFFNDFANFPDEGISSRHGKGAVIATVTGSAERMATNTFYALTGGRAPSGMGGTRWSTLPAGSLPNRLWCSPNNNGHP